MNIIKNIFLGLIGTLILPLILAIEIIANNDSYNIFHWWKETFFGHNRNKCNLRKRSYIEKYIGMFINFEGKEYKCMGVNINKTSCLHYKLSHTSSSLRANIPYKEINTDDFYHLNVKQKNIDLLDSEHLAFLQKKFTELPNYVINYDNDGLSFYENSTKKYTEIKWKNNSSTKIEIFTTECYEYISKYLDI